jgi:hypothetical protein
MDTFALLDALVLRLPMLDRLGGIAVLHGHAPQR